MQRLPVEARFPSRAPLAAAMARELWPPARCEPAEAPAAAPLAAGPGAASSVCGSQMCRQAWAIWWPASTVRAVAPGTGAVIGGSTAVRSLVIGVAARGSATSAARSSSRIRASPTVTMSPAARSAAPTLRPLTRIPLRLPRSVTRGTGPDASNSACRREIFVSATLMSHSGARPTVSLPMNSSSRSPSGVTTIRRRVRTNQSQSVIP